MTMNDEPDDRQEAARRALLGEGAAAFAEGRRPGFDGGLELTWRQSAFVCRAMRWHLMGHGTVMQPLTPCEAAVISEVAQMPSGFLGVGWAALVGKITEELLEKLAWKEGALLDGHYRHLQEHLAGVVFSGVRKAGEATRSKITAPIRPHVASNVTRHAILGVNLDDAARAGIIAARAEHFELDALLPVVTDAEKAAVIRFGWQAVVDCYAWIAADCAGPELGELVAPRTAPMRGAE